MQNKKRKLLYFDDWYKIAEKYYNEHGDLLVPANYIDSNGNALGYWIAHIRSYYKNPKSGTQVTIEQTQRLEKIGMIWETHGRHTWDEWLSQCELYHKSNGNLLVPLSYKTDDYNLGRWIEHQRYLYKNELLSKERIQSLEKYDMAWEAPQKDFTNSQWNVYYDIAAKYFREHGDLNVPSDMIAIAGKKVSLKNWLSLQKDFYNPARCKTALRLKRHTMLQAIGMTWNEAEVKEEPAHKARTKNRANREAIWIKNYNEIKELIENGHRPVHSRDVTLTSGISGAYWINTQRTAIKNGKLDDSKKKMLADIGIVYGIHDEKWYKNYNRIKQFVDKYHRLPKNDTEVKMENGISTRSWILGQRAVLSSGKTTEEKKKLLNDIGIFPFHTKTK